MNYRLLINSRHLLIKQNLNDMLDHLMHLIIYSISFEYDYRHPVINQILARQQKRSLSYTLTTRNALKRNRKEAFKFHKYLHLKITERK